MHLDESACSETHMWCAVVHTVCIGLGPLDEFWTFTLVALHRACLYCCLYCCPGTPWKAPHYRQRTVSLLMVWNRYTMHNGVLYSRCFSMQTADSEPAYGVEQIHRGWRAAQPMHTCSVLNCQAASALYSLFRACGWLMRPASIDTRVLHVHQRQFMLKLEEKGACKDLSALWRCDVACAADGQGHNKRVKARQPGAWLVCAAFFFVLQSLLACHAVHASSDETADDMYVLAVPDAQHG